MDDVRCLYVTQAPGRRPMGKDGPVKIGLARAAATRWVTRHACREAGFGGAFFGGWTAGLSDNAELPPDADLNVMVVLGRDTAPESPGRFLYHGVLLDVTYVAWPVLLSA